MATYTCQIGPPDPEIAALRAEVAQERGMAEGARIVASNLAARVSEVVAERDALRARIAELEAAIKAHNDGCVAACESRQEAQYCDPYIERGRQCVDCPRDNMIELPVQSASVAPDYAPMPDGIVEDADDALLGTKKTATPRQEEGR